MFDRGLFYSKLLQSVRFTVNVLTFNLDPSVQNGSVRRPAVLFMLRSSVNSRPSRPAVHYSPGRASAAPAWKI